MNGMNSSKTLIIAMLLATLLIGGVGLYIYTKTPRANQNDTQSTSTSDNSTGTTSNKDNGANTDTSGNDTTENDQNETNQDSNSTPPGTFTTYSEEKVKNAEGDIVLFFNASWCPTCKALTASLNASRNDIPAEVTILSVDYDTYTELKQKYGVTYQHTLVQVDNNGNQIQKWSGGYDLDSILSKI